jgi:transcriptional regulator with XRE-family HTH domain
VSSSLALRIDRLVRSYLNPKGREYSYREVAAAISKSEGSHRRGEAISAAYIWGLRTGVKENPTLKHLQALSAFFQVAPSFFFDEELTQVPEDSRILAATARGPVRRLAVAVLELSEESLAAVIHLVSHLRELEGLPPVEETAAIDSGRTVVVSMPAVEPASTLALEPA